MINIEEYEGYYNSTLVIVRSQIEHIVESTIKIQRP